MLDDLLLHPQTRTTLEAILQHPPQSVLLVGVEGIGKHTIASRLALGVGRKLECITTLGVDEPITIETIRSLYATSRSKGQRQVIILENTDTMSPEAANAFLKLLEEPRPELYFILTATQADAVLLTIRSRTQMVSVHQLEESVLRAVVSERTDAAQLLFMANGRPGLLYRFMHDQSFAEASRQAMQQAKQLLTATTYQRLSAINHLVTQREECVLLLEAMLRMAQAQLSKASNPQIIQQWIGRAEVLEHALLRIRANAHLKLQLLQVFTSL